MANRDRIIEKVQCLIDDKGVGFAVQALITALDIIGDQLLETTLQREFFENLASDLIKEKQQRIRKEKGVVYVAGEMFVKEPPIASRCDGCICQTCENEQT